MRRPSNPSNEGTNERLDGRPRRRSRTAAPDEPGTERAGNRERDRPERVARNGPMQRIERASRVRRERPRCRRAAAAVVSARPRGRSDRSSRPRRPRRPVPLEPAPAAGAAGRRRPRGRETRGLARDHRRGVGAAAVGVLNRRDAAGARRPGGCDEQEPGRSGDLRPHAAEVNSWACGAPAPRRCDSDAICGEFDCLVGRRGAQRSSNASGTTFRCRSAASSST